MKRKKTPRKAVKTTPTTGPFSANARAARMKTHAARKQRESAVERLSYTPRETCAALGVSRPTLKGMLDRGELAHVKTGSRILIPKLSLDKFLADR